MLSARINFNILSLTLFEQNKTKQNNGKAVNAANKY